MPIRSSRKKTDTTKRRHQVAKLYESGMTQPEIAAYFGLNKSTISRDMEWMRKEWVASGVRDFDAHKAAELAKVDALELEYWEAWRRSIGTSTTVKEVYRGKKEHEDAERLYRREVDTQEHLGDPSWLRGVQSCISERCKILGLYAATKQEHSGAHGGPIATESNVNFDYSKLSTEQITQLLAISESATSED